MLATRLPLSALHQAISDRQPPPGVVHHSDRGIQYASGTYVHLLRQHQMIPSISRPANPYDNASCESFLKTFKREEIYATTYRDLCARTWQPLSTSTTTAPGWAIVRCPHSRNTSTQLASASHLLCWLLSSASISTDFLTTSSFQDSIPS